MNRTMSLLVISAATGLGGCNPPTVFNVRAIAPNTTDAQVATGDSGSSANSGAVTSSIVAAPPASPASSSTK